MVRVWAPRVTPPDPVKVVIDAPDAVPAMENVPPSKTPLELAIDPEPDRPKVPDVIVVAPV
jgi:hypothetical protein